MINILDILRKKRFGEELTDAEIGFIVQGAADGTIPDYQLAAWLMAVSIHGMTDRETLSLTMHMAGSGSRLDLSDIPGVKADKHSTGGVGDTTSLVLVPLVACCGVKMAKMSGRGLGFTGGTLDKLESVPGLSVFREEEAFKEQVRKIGCAIVGQTRSLAPADKVLYALRDVTSTVDCMPLIVSSIVSKKLAAGCDVVVMDVKTGSGALMEKLEDSVELARQMVRIGNRSGRHFSAVLTDMDQPLGNQIGNALEVEEAIRILSGEEEGDLKEVSLVLGAHILKNAGIARSIDDGKAMLEEKIRSGEGLRKLAEMFEAQGGDGRVCFDVRLLPQAKETLFFRAERSGYLESVRANQLGEAARLLGAGRMHKSDVIDPAVGLIMRKRTGEEVRVGEVLCELRVSESSNVAAATEILRNAITVSDVRPAKRPLIIETIE